jgi:hypothetical protein
VHADPFLDVPLLFRWLEDQGGGRYLLIGRQAVRLYGAPVSTMDVDLWLPPADRRAFLQWLEDQDMELSDPPSGSRPIVRVLAGVDRIGAFFVRAMTNQEGVELEFDRLWTQARRLTDATDGIAVRVPDVPDLIALKRMRPPNAKDDEDIRFLEVRRALEAQGRIDRDR